MHLVGRRRRRRHRRRSGTITSGGLYTPPSRRRHAHRHGDDRGSSQSANATVYVSELRRHVHAPQRQLADRAEPQRDGPDAGERELGDLREALLATRSTASRTPRRSTSRTSTIPGRASTTSSTSRPSTTASTPSTPTGGARRRCGRSLHQPGRRHHDRSRRRHGRDAATSREIGITGTPVIDPATNTIYVVAKTKEVTGGTTSTSTAARARHRDRRREVRRPGRHPGERARDRRRRGRTGRIPFDPLTENQRPALLLNNGVVYIGFASHGDNQPYHGWLLGYNADDAAAGPGRSARRRTARAAASG